MMLNAGNNLLWSTPVYKTNIDSARCEQLVSDLMLTENLADPSGDALSNLIANPTLAKLAKEKYSEFFRDVYNVDINSLDYEFKAWLTGTKGGYSMETHNHTGAQFVSVFYILSEETNAGGEIVLQDPRFNANRGFNNIFVKEFESVVHKPKTGDVLIFPGYVYHFVRQYTSQLRLAIPVDIFIKE
jgi:hypothetical protein